MYQDMMLPKILTKEKIIFANITKGLERFFSLEHRRVKFGDREDDRIVWNRGNFIFIVAITTDNEIVAIKEYKHGVEQTVLCLPAGAVEEGEDIADAALRELKEETGYIGKKENSRIFGPYFNSPDKSTERQYVVVIDGVCQKGKTFTEENETIIKVELYPFEIKELSKKFFIGMNLTALYIANENFYR